MKNYNEQLNLKEKQKKKYEEDCFQHYRSNEFKKIKIK